MISLLEEQPFGNLDGLSYMESLHMKIGVKRFGFIQQCHVKCSLEDGTRARLASQHLQQASPGPDYRVRTGGH